MLKTIQVHSNPKNDFFKWTQKLLAHETQSVDLSTVVHCVSTFKVMFQLRMKPYCIGGPPWLRGFVGAYLPAVPGSNSKRIIYALPVYSQILYYICHCVEKKAESIHKEARFGQY